MTTRAADPPSHPHSLTQPHLASPDDPPSDRELNENDIDAEPLNQLPSSSHSLNSSLTEHSQNSSLTEHSQSDAESHEAGIAPHHHDISMVTTTTVTQTTRFVASCDAQPHDDHLISTPNGPIRVKPYISTARNDLRSALNFVPRFSSFDRENERSQTDQFRGFFTLFWISLALLFARTSLDSWKYNHTILSTNFGRLITRDAAVLAFADGIMVSSMLLCVPFVKCLEKGYFNYYWTGCIIQHVFQTTFLFVAVAWGYARDWYWVQAGFLVLHALSCMMKMHSYMAHNGMLSTVYARLQQERKTLSDYIDTLPGGMEQALRDATSRQDDLEAKEAAAPQISEPSSVPRTPQIVTSDEGTQFEEKLNRLAVNPNLRNRRKSLHPATDALPPPAKDLPKGTSLEPSHEVSPHEPCHPAQLSWSSDPRVALLARNIDQMQDELRSNGKDEIVWPENVTYKNFVEFMFFPTLVYELEYPRTTVRRPMYILEKVLATFGTFSLIYTVTEHYIMPYTPTPGTSIVEAFTQLALPMMINFLLIFYIIFECVCAGFAELSFFADREFYQDWWNSTSWDQFSRRWNKPVYTFLLRHVYASSMTGWRLSRWAATLVTFFLSALCHELVMAVVSKKIRPYLFLLQMVQLPLIALSRVPVIKRNHTLGNIVFWAGLMIGFPLLEICYLVY